MSSFETAMHNIGSDANFDFATAAAVEIPLRKRHLCALRGLNKCAHLGTQWESHEQILEPGV